MNSIKISIIVPVYNVEPFVEDCIRSVMRQTYDGSMECIVVDDCGTDYSISVVESLIAEYSGPITFKILHHEHNRGLSAARNTGMDAATGDYLFFLDSDDELTDDCIDKLVCPVLSEPYDLVVGNMMKIDSFNRELITTAKLKLNDNTVLKDDEIIAAHFEGMWNVAAWNKLYSSKFLHRHHICFFEGIIHEDVLWTFQIACLAQQLLAINSVTYRYKKRDVSIMNNSSLKKRVDSYAISLSEMCKFYKEKEIKSDYAIRVILFYFYYTLRLCFRHFLLYVRTYKKIRSCTKELFLKENGERERMKSYNFRDIHYYLPPFVAPTWLYLYTLLTIIKDRL